MDVLHGGTHVSSFIFPDMISCLNATYSKANRHADARAVFSDISRKRLDWPEAVWEAWVSFEQLYGSVDDLETCLDKVEQAQIQVSNQRMRVSL